MAWPFTGNSGEGKSADKSLSEERLKILSNVAIEQVVGCTIVVAVVVDIEGNTVRNTGFHR